MINIGLTKTEVDIWNYNFAKNLMNFFQVIHGENAFEIRILSQDKYKTTRSILRQGDSLYIDGSKNKKVKTAEYTANSFYTLLDIEYQSSMGGEVFFTVNSPNFNTMDTCKASDLHIKDIGTITAQFVDIDAPKEIKQSKIELVKWKIRVKEKILGFTLSPSIVVETKNGYHVYWLLENGKTQLFRCIQMQLVQYFNGDHKCVNESRILRVPWFPHRKNPREPFPITVKKFAPKNRYTQEQLKDTLPDLEAATLSKVMHAQEESKSLEPIRISSTRKNEVIKLLLKYTSFVNEYENKITMHCCMPDHPDHNPSAWLDTDYMWYHCSGCGRSVRISELAEELGWKDVLEAWNKYDIGIDLELQSIRDHFVDVKNIEHLTLSIEEQKVVDSISLKVIDKLNNFDQSINQKHKDYIREVVQVLLKANNEKPYLLPLDMGAGKSLITEIFLQERLKTEVDIGAVVVVERKEDVKRIAKHLNDNVGGKLAYPLYGFDEHECLKNRAEGLELEYCPASIGKKCPFQKECRFWNQANEQQNYRVVVMTAQRLYLQSDELNKYQFYKDRNTEQIGKREQLIIDEKPKNTFIQSLNKVGFDKYNEIILNVLRSSSFDGDLELYYEYKDAIEKIVSLYNFNVRSRNIFKPLEKKFKFSVSFWHTFRNKFNYNQEVFKIPRIIESIIKHGGHIDARDFVDITITTSHCIDYRKFKLFNTIIFDGTADIDSGYKYEEYQACKFDPIRTYEGLTFYTSNLINGSKTSMMDDEKLKAFCDDIKAIADENPKEKIFLPVFKDIKESLTGHLKKYIDNETILVAHYGSTRGSNKFKDCSIVILGGILHKTENYYIGKSMALHEPFTGIISDTECSNFNKVRRFNDKTIEMVKLLDMLVDYSQEIKRCKQRDNSRNIEGKVYVFHNDKILLDILNMKFPGSKVEDWIPKNAIEKNIYKKKNNETVRKICDYLKNHTSFEISFAEVKNALNLSKQTFANKLKNEMLQAFLIANHIVIEKRGLYKSFIKVVSK